MQQEHSTRRVAGARRRKIALACEPCRERKSRCDGGKPVCASCDRRGFPIGRCVYKAENARSASSDEYIQTLHQRIRELEGNPGTQASVPTAECSNNPRNIPDSENNYDPDTSGGTLGLGATQTRIDEAQVLPDHHQISLDAQDKGEDTNTAHSSCPFESPSNVTAMGAMTGVDDNECFPNQSAEYFGSSSTASLMSLLSRNHEKQSRHAWVSRRQGPLNPSLNGQDLNQSSLSAMQLEDLLLPPRALADHLLACFWDRVYCLYPFFDRRSFQDAYENLWISRNHGAHELSSLNIGLGDRVNSGSRSVVFSCALNAIFALGCHFSDIPIEQREAVAHQFFLRAKHHIGLDMIDIQSIGVVQALLIVALFLQSTGYPHRCWSSIGMACRLALGFGLHEPHMWETKHPLEQEIQRRTWYGCVMMDMTVSMTYGRPSMTTYITSIPLPGIFDLESRRETDGPTLITFYNSTIRLYSILDIILSDVYNAWRGRSSETTDKIKQEGGLDMIIRIEDRLRSYKSSLPDCLNWNQLPGSTVPSSHQSIIDRQRNVLHARFLYLHVLLYRPMLTHMCFGEQSNESSSYLSSSVHSFVSVKCGNECIRAAIDLVSLVYETHKILETDTWWYNGFYTSTAAMVLIMSHTCRDPHHLDIEKTTIEIAWKKSERILKYMASFSISAQNTLTCLQGIRNRVLRKSNSDPGLSQNNDKAPQDSSIELEQQNTGLLEITSGILNSDDGTLLEDWGFLGPFDLSDFQDWFPQVA